MAASNPPCPLLISRSGQSLENYEFINDAFWICSDDRLNGLTQGGYNSILDGLRGAIATVLARPPTWAEWDAWPDAGSDDWAPAAPPSSPMSAPARPPHLSQRQGAVIDRYPKALISPPLRPPPKRRKIYQAPTPPAEAEDADVGSTPPSADYDVTEPPTGPLAEPSPEAGAADTDAADVVSSSTEQPPPAPLPKQRAKAYPPPEPRPEGKRSSTGRVTTTLICAVAGCHRNREAVICDHCAVHCADPRCPHHFEFPRRCHYENCMHKHPGPVLSACLFCRLHCRDDQTCVYHNVPAKKSTNRTSA